MNEEVELKLELSPDAADTFEQAAALPGEAQAVRQRSLYFDTPEHDLARVGMSLRIRSDGERSVQTVKADGGRAAGLFVRPEWEQPVYDDVPVVDDSTPMRALLGDKVDHLAPTFEVVIDRRIWNLDDEGARIQVALDRGHVALPGERQAAICELELEQKAGTLEALFAVARKMNLQVPVFLNVLTKAERGYRLLGPAPRYVKAEDVVLDENMHAASAFQHLARACLRHFRLNEALLMERHDPEAVHQARVALRRLRSALSIHKTMLADGQMNHLKDELRWLSSKLGETRDLDVLRERITDGVARNKVDTARSEAYGLLLAAITSQRSRDLMLDLAEWLVSGDWLRQQENQERRDQLVREFAAQALDRARRKLRLRNTRLEHISDEERHDLRKAAKKLRYASEFYASIYKGKRERRRYKAFVGALKELQDHLGELNDLATAPQVLDNLDLQDAAARNATAGRTKTELVASAAEAHDALMDTKRFWR